MTDSRYPPAAGMTRAASLAVETRRSTTPEASSAPEAVEEVRGSEAEILKVLRGLRVGRTSTGRTGGGKRVAIQRIKEGNRSVVVDGRVYVVVDRPWTIEQDVYGCEKGRGCTSVDDVTRNGFESMIRERYAALGLDRSQCESAGWTP